MLVPPGHTVEAWEVRRRVGFLRYSRHAETRIGL
jgi:hypothetical protein